MKRQSDIFTGLRAQLYALRIVASGLFFVYKKTLSSVELKEGELLLDIGCGTGTLLIKIAKKFGGAVNLFGIDGSPDMIARATTEAARSEVAVKFKIAYADDLPFPAETFRVVTSTLMAHHIPPQEKEKMVGEVKRVLKHGGVFIITDLGRPKNVFGRFMVFASRSHAYLRDNMEVIEAALIKEGLEITNRSTQFGYVEHLVAVKP